MTHHLPITLPEMALVRQKFFTSGITDVSAAVRASIASMSVLPGAGKGETVAVAVGSRHISRLDIVVDQCLRFLEQNGYQPFIVPAMGSHGGATADGQKNILAKYGITEASMNVPIHADMETQTVAVHPFGMDIVISKAALAADHIVLINRIKPHTKFKADIESGLCKMMTIGLGKDTGAAGFHRYAVDQGFGIIQESAEILLQKLNILFGVGLVEDAYGNPAHIEAVLPDRLIAQEIKLLKKAKELMGGIPFDPVDILVIDYFGKDISGIGMDSNITGRHRDIVGDIKIAPHVKRIFVRDLSPGSDGNANGIGLADFTTHRLVKSMDIEKTYVNAVTAISPEKAAIPIHFENDRKCLEACVKTTGITELRNLRIVRIKDTASLKYLLISRAFEHELKQNSNLTRISDWTEPAFTPSGDLTAFVSDP